MRVKFEQSVNSIPLEIHAVVYDGKIDEFTVYASGVIVTEILSDAISDNLKQEVLKIAK